MLPIAKEALAEQGVEFEVHELRTLDESGDTKIMWDRSKSAEVDNARDTFNNLKKKKYKAFSVKKDGEAGDVMPEFDPDAEKIIMVPPMAGG